MMKAKLIEKQERDNQDVFDFYLVCLAKEQEDAAFADWLSEMYSHEQDDLAMLEGGMNCKE